MSWEHFYRLAKEVANKIKSSGYVPDMVIGLARGGWCLARVLCDFIGVKDLVSLKVEHWGITATPDGKAKLKYPFNIDLTGKKVLVVDDITDTGESMRISVDYVKTLNPSEVRTAALRHIEGSKFKPDYYAEKITWRWVIFPWNFVEDLCNLVEKVQSEVDKPSDTKLLKAKLKEYFKVDVDEETVREILAELDRRRNLRLARP
ncbi:phosphoribosyltransferase [Candidatus Bathyarchaeota archaeon]|nr:phosphoribosyltransferase [Candidatus Bathyarchaeota archaeon]